MKRLTVKQIELVKIIFNKLYRSVPTNCLSDLKLLEDLFSRELNGIEKPEEQDWTETVTAEIRAKAAK